ncbi:hypothetical protein E8F11_01015 [Pseudomonas sp. BN417]|nr:hypothetical protein [Pseudomonas sp. BN417]
MRGFLIVGIGCKAFLRPDTKELLNAGLVPACQGLDAACQIGELPDWKAMSAFSVARRSVAKLIVERASAFCFASRRVTSGSRPRSNQEGLPLHPGPAAPDSPRSIVAPGARREGPSMAPHASRGIHAARPSLQRLRSAS